MLFIGLSFISSISLLSIAHEYNENWINYEVCDGTEQYIIVNDEVLVHKTDRKCNCDEIEHPKHFAGVPSLRMQSFIFKNHKVAATKPSNRLN